VANSPGERGVVVSVNISPAKGARKKPAGSGTLLEEMGLAGDAHAGFDHRQVSLLAVESIDKMKALGLDVGPGDFAENVTTSGVDLVSIPIGTLLRLGESLLEVSQIGKICHSRCAIFDQAGDCVMPREGIFARVLSGGDVRVGDLVEVLRKEPEHA
jgi:MOSC domain-containing protein YiiM